MTMKLIAPTAAGLLLAVAGAAHAAQKTATFTVSATVLDNCVISAANMNLGTFDGTNDLAATSDISVSCTNGKAYDVSLSAGNSGNSAARTLSNGVQSLVYNLYTSAGYGTIWDAANVVSGTGAGMATTNTHTVYGRLLASDNTGAIDAGTYTDTITATIVY